MELVPTLHSNKAILAVALGLHTIPQFYGEINSCKIVHIETKIKAVSSLHRQHDSIRHLIA